MNRKQPAKVKSSFVSLNDYQARLMPLGGDELVAALRELSTAVIEYGRTDMADAAEAEWDRVLAADKAARAALAKLESSK